MATDEDREGEAIAWHTAEILGRNIDEIKRVAFHEITPSAVLESFQKPRKIDLSLVNAQQARRILDRIVGYELSPFLKRALGRVLSAGRVQSVALFLIVQREKEINGFVPVPYWKIRVFLVKDGKKFYLDLVSIDGKKLEATEINTQEMVDKIVDELKNGVVEINSVDVTTRNQRPFPPFITSTLQQEAGIKLGFSSTKTMKVAQELYEGVSLGKRGRIGLITYMRTDSPSVARVAQQKAIFYIKEKFGANYVPDRPPIYKTRSSTAQEAHEAIRPTQVNLEPDGVKAHLSKEQYRLYKLVWDRFIASQMKSAVIETVAISANCGRYGLETKMSTIVFDGFMKVLPIKIDEGQYLETKLSVGEKFPVVDTEAKKEMTRPPARYTEATLIKTLEKFGIGRPSTYAPTIATLYRRRYIHSEKKSLVPEELGMKITDILTEYFPDIINVEFTAKMEESLDEIAEGKKNWIETLQAFYNSFLPALDRAALGIKNARPAPIKKPAEEVGRSCPKCGKPLLVRESRRGQFIGCSGFPKCKYIESEKKPAEEVGRPCPKCGKPLLMRHSRYGQFIGCSGFPECKYTESIKK
jgi:DNA topoisomerase-1